MIINYPEPDFRIKKGDNNDFIFDPIRKKWILLTPEEWVRQNFIQFLVQVKKYPASLIAIEKEIKVGELKKRFDILVHDKNFKARMLVECKAPEITLDEKTLHQALRYSIAVPASLIVITNGAITYAWKKELNNLVLSNEIPGWQ